MAVAYRRAKESDFSDSIEVLKQAFAPSCYEATLVALLWRNEKISAHYVATEAGKLVGYIAYSLGMAPGGLPIGLHLAPIAVHPAAQRRGIGRGLLNHSLDDLGSGVPLFVLGEPAFYGRFGFVPDPTLHSCFDETGGNFQVLGRGIIAPGEVLYEPEFHQAFNEVADRTVNKSANEE
ncbi:MAG: N-acetyltransferase [Deltaproteobacteria bacterium]|nr:N-acetyltransferase [Deltaproteobacteria bacterium]